MNASSNDAVASSFAMRSLACETSDRELLGAWLARHGETATEERLLWQYFVNPTKKVFVDVTIMPREEGVLAVHAAVPGWMRFRGERQLVLTSTPPPHEPRFSSEASTAAYGSAEALDAAVTERTYARATADGAALAYGFVDARAATNTFATRGWSSLGPAPLLVRPLRLRRAAERWGLPRWACARLPELPLLAPFARSPSSGFRDVSSLSADVRITRLWDRFSVDVGMAIERNTSYFRWRIGDRPGGAYRTFIVEDGDRYAIRAMCIFTVRTEAEHKVGYVMELLHDRSVAGMRSAFHVLGLALREMSDTGADLAVAWSLRGSGSYPLYALHAFATPPARLRPNELRFGVRALDPALEVAVTQRDRWYLSLIDDLTI